MTLTLHYHPLSSFCHKVLIGLYELGVAFDKHVVDLGEPESRAAFAALWPLAKFPVVRDGERILPESTIILEYLDQRAAPPRLIPADPARALECRLRDRLYDLHIHLPMQKIVGDRIRPAGARDPHGVAQAEAQIRTTYGIIDAQLRDARWAAGDAFGLADCAAAPALFYANKVVPFADHPHIAAYFARLSARPSYARVLAEAAPYLAMFPA